MEKIALDVIGLSYSQNQSGSYALVLQERGGDRRLPVMIGGAEAQAIAIELESMTPSRPLTHDLFKTFATTFRIEVREVIIYNLIEGIFYAKICCAAEGSTELVEIDARTSDAVALAVRFKAPVYTYERILGTAGIVSDDRDEPALGEHSGIEEVERQLDLKGGEPTIEELNEQLLAAIEREDYEAASRLRDEISQREKDK